MNTTLRLLISALVSGASFAVPMSVQAQALVNPSVSYSGNAGRVAMGSLNQVGNSFRTWAANSAVAGEVLIKDSIVARVGAANANMYAVRAVPFIGVLKLASRALPWIGAASVAYSIYDAMRCQKKEGSTTSLECDAGKASTMETVYCFNLSSGKVCHSTPMGVSMMAAEQAYKGYQLMAGDPACIKEGTNAKSCYVKYWVDMPDPRDTKYYWALFQPNPEQGLKCADNRSGDTYVQSYAGPDGRCTTLAPKVETSFDDAAAKIAPYTATSKAVEILPQVAPYVDISPYAELRPMLGPQSVTGPAETTTTTPVSGPAQTTTTYPVYNITYSGDTYTYTTVNNTTNPDGSTKTETKPADETKSQCELTPEAVGCAKFGDPGQAPSIPKTSIPVGYVKTLFASPATCPADMSMAIMHKVYPLSYAPLCSTLATIRLIFLATGAAAAAMVFAEGLKS